MGDRPLKEALLSTLAAAKDRERVLVQHCDDSSPSDPSEWTVKDHVAHLAHWRRHAAGVLDLARTAGAAPAPETIDEINARVYASNRDRPASEVKVEAARSFEVLRAAIEECTEEQLMASRPGRSGKVWEVVPGDGHAHTGQHVAWWLLAEGDDREAEEVQVWVRDLALASFPGAEQEGNADYNLACFYALQGRAAEAMPLIEKALELNPSLKEWSRGDSDLNRIRDLPDMQRLLA